MKSDQQTADESYKSQSCSQHQSSKTKTSTFKTKVSKNAHTYIAQNNSPPEDLVFRHY